MSRLEHQAVMQYHDGELSPAEAHALEWRLAADPELRGVLAGLEQIGAVLVAVADARATPADDIADSVMRRVGAEASGVRPRVTVLAGGAGAIPAAEPASLELRVRRRPWAAAAGLAATSLVAAAACVAFFGLTEREAERPVLALSARPSDWTPQRRAGPVTSVFTAPTRVDMVPAIAIESVDFGARNGAIFMVRGETVDTPVVWLVDDHAETGDRMDLP